jgi:CBS domain-containing protein
MRRTVEDVMTRRVVVAGPSAGFKQLVTLMETYRVSAVPVVDSDARLLGIVSEGDLLLKEEGADRAPRHLFEGRARRSSRIKASALVAVEAMTTPVVSVRPEATLREAARLMHEHRVKRLPVVDSEDRVIGIVSRADLLRVFLRPDEELRHEITEDILHRDLWIDPDDVRVSVTRGIVRLEGRVERKSLARIAVRVVSGVDGVIGVEDRLGYEIDDETTPIAGDVPYGTVRA